MTWRWAAQYDGVLEAGTLYPCAKCGFPGLTKDTSAWEWGPLERGAWGSVWVYLLVCEELADCWRRAEFMGTAPWLDVVQEARS